MRHTVRSCKFSGQKTLCERSYCVSDKKFLHPFVKTKYFSLRVRCGPETSENSFPIDFKFSGLMPVCTKKIRVNFFCKTPSVKKVMGSNQKLMHLTLFAMLCSRRAMFHANLRNSKSSCSICLKFSGLVLVVMDNIFVKFGWKQLSTKKWLPGTQQVFEHY